ncbi:MAG: hypothetical protein IT210_21765 [Armatimonadetes bacterium]|nr:hypothetical protein [Armatimonadota bacterium]
MSTVIHVSHEAAYKIGGIGAVFEGLISSRAYQESFDRTLLVGPLYQLADEGRIEQEGEVWYSSITGIDRRNLQNLFHPLEYRFDVNFVYGQRILKEPIQKRQVPVEVLLIDPGHLNPRLAMNFKYLLYRDYGIPSDRYESFSDYELYVRLAGPAYEAALRLIGNAAGPHYLIAHEYMGIPTALRALLDPARPLTALYHAHEVPTVRALVETIPGHDTVFYNRMRQARAEGKRLEDTFGDQSGFYKHALSLRGAECDGAMAVGDYVLEELEFLSPDFERTAGLTYNGIPATEISWGEKQLSRRRLQDYTQALLGYRPDMIFTHVTRLVVSKGLWRDLKALHYLDGQMASAGQRGVFWVLATVGGAGKHAEEISRMESDYGWPVRHREGYPDLAGAEVEFWHQVEKFNREARAVQVVFQNQFGFHSESARWPAGMGFADLRRGSDAEFGQSIYEPFGIAQLEPLSFGAVCVVSDACGCLGFYRKVSDPADDLVIAANYTRLPSHTPSAALYERDGWAIREKVEDSTAREVARALYERLNAPDEIKQARLRRGYELASRMSWDRVVQDYFKPALLKAAAKRE